MRRFDEKVRDIVEVRSSPPLCDFWADPTAALAGYHFTDITADLMSKWLDRVVGMKKGNGAALALAGYRGVGKSHFLAALSAVIRQPELRNGISDPHVAASAERLSRRHGFVAHVKRGSQDSLFREFQAAISGITGDNSTDGSDSIPEMMAAAAAKGGDVPPVLVIDTEFGRECRVTRDDGLLLSEIAAAAREYGVFVGLALDDDIAGADGINSSIASSFEIDYLDQEHLYKIVNTYVFAKYEQRWPLLHEIYESYRQSLPGFRWSETRFSSLYPLHPAIVEIAPFVRLYLHDFALLGFAAEAGMRILGRPANSLIGLDEVFDSVEDRLRHVVDLKSAFEVYDALDRKVVAAATGMQRHEAKVILKGLFLLSLTGDGVTPDELAAVMLIFDDKAGSSAASTVEGFLDAFAQARPGSVRTSGGKYILRKGSEDNVDSALEAAIEGVSADVVWPILRRQTAEKYVDLMQAEDDTSSTKCNVVWRGSVRGGMIIWTGTPPDEVSEWRVFVTSSANEVSPALGNTPSCEWRLAKLSDDDVNTLKRFHVLQTDAEFRERYRDSVPTVLHVHMIAVEKIWQRVFLEEGYLVADTGEYRFSEEARSAHTLSQLFTLALGDYFAALYPDHPQFEEVLDDRQVARLVEHLFSGAAPATQEVQKLAADLAVPLGLVREVDGVYLPLESAELLELPVVKAMLSDTPVEKNGLLRMEELSRRMQEAPYGLTREAQHLVLAALVGQRQYEFVTSSDNRINYRSLDLQIVWNDIVGIAKGSDEGLSDERLLKWAVVLTGSESLRSLKGSNAREAVTEALSTWLREWRGRDVLAQFDAVADEKLNTRLWRVGMSVKRTFGAAADAVEELLQETSTLDQCLQAIADAFWDSDHEYVSKLVELELLKALLEHIAVSDEIHNYLLLCESTGGGAVDGLRAKLIEKMSPGVAAEPDASELRADFEKFKELYAERYAERHDMVMTSADGKLEKYLSSHAWTTFSDLASTGIFGGQDHQLAMAVVRKIRSSVCTFDVHEILRRQPHCDCSFSMPDDKDTDMLIEELNAVVEAGLNFFHQRLVEQRPLGRKGKAVPDIPQTGLGLADLSARQMQALKSTLRGAAAAPAADGRRPTNGAVKTLDPDDLDELESRLDQLGPS